MAKTTMEMERELRQERALETFMSVFDEMIKLNVNDHTEKKNVGGKELTYLSWPWAWAETKKRFPDAHYEIWKNEQHLPFVYDPATGYMVFTSVTIGGITHEMWLAVMDGANNAMKAQPYEYTVKNPNFKWAKLDPSSGKYKDKYGNVQTEYITKKVEAASMTDINKTIMRCLVKNLAMFGLGLYIYAGEDLPEGEQPEEKPQDNSAAAALREFYPTQVTKQETLPLEQRVNRALGVKEEPQPPKPETPGAYIKRSIAEIKVNNPSFDFMKSRAALIKGGVIEDVPSATMNMEQAKALISAITANLSEAS